MNKTPPPLPLRAGMMLGSSLRLVRRLGEGGMGTVWLADQLALESRVVVKFMARDLAKDAAAVARFSREATLAAQVRSPHVVQVFDHGITREGMPYIVMEQLDGVDLDQHLDAVGRMPPAEVATLVTQLANALSRAHKLGVVHRDLKPSNVFLTDGGAGSIFVKLLDFGIARSTEKLTRLTRTGVVFGTPHYMAPETLVDPDLVTPASDLWALAAVAYEALTGERAFDGETIAAVTLRIHAPTRPKPSQVIPGVPPALDAWFERALALDPAARFPDVRAMVDAFVEAQSGAPIRPSASAMRIESARLPTLDGTATIAVQAPPAKAETKAPVRSRKPLFAALGGVVLALLGFAVVRARAFDHPVHATVASARQIETEPPQAASVAPSASVVLVQPIVAAPAPKPIAKSVAAPVRSAPAPSASSAQVAPVALNVPVAPVESAAPPPSATPPSPPKAFDDVE